MGCVSLHSLLLLLTAAVWDQVCVRGDRPNSTPQNRSTTCLSAALNFSFHQWRGETTRNKTGVTKMYQNRHWLLLFPPLLFLFPYLSCLFFLSSPLQCESGWSQWQHDIMEMQSPTLSPSKWHPATKCNVQSNTNKEWCALKSFEYYVLLCISNMLSNNL